MPGARLSRRFESPTSAGDRLVTVSVVSPKTNVVAYGSRGLAEVDVNHSVRHGRRVLDRCMTNNKSDRYSANLILEAHKKLKERHYLVLYSHDLHSVNLHSL